MRIAVKDSEGNVFTNDMSEDNERFIYEMHFCTSYTQVLVQTKDVNDEGDEVFIDGEIIIECADTPDDLTKGIDYIAVSSEEIGSWANVNCSR